MTLRYAGVAVGALIGAAIAGLGPVQARPLLNPVRYTCPESGDLTVERNSASAHVEVAGRSYDLQRKRSSIGEKYISPNAALIIDGPSAVFVAEDRLDLGTCVRAEPVTT